ncbi:MAG: TIGR00289 family protein [Euryarchaeota archaeon]|nr:TIGR00289 family protein [Euryarchaeota archaeon]MBU4607790.1 TIGR00289 family protein [Euryarchaeota archaeon]MBV1729891.1 TIGR00289 family protein [Methanobacterium sp.]MBV1755940.1 TIGR00289 family protein [Methanobacterium sp.]MBV1767708.1 TIGR00289 family protein [Methanobacterium sp.]
MKVAVLFSGGKDSTMALKKAQEEGHQVLYLLSMISENPDSYMYHVPNIHITQLSAQALDIPLLQANTRGVKEKELNDLEIALTKLKNRGVEAIFSGALSSIYQKSRIDDLCHKLDLKSVAPLWDVDPYLYMQDIINQGWQVIITGVAAEGLDESWLGRIIDQKALEDIKKLHDKFGIHMAFEGGEAETLVVDGPLFKKKINIIKAENHYSVDSGYYLIKEAVLEDK